MHVASACMQGGKVASTQVWNVATHALRSEAPPSSPLLDRHCFKLAAQGGSGGGGGSAMSTQLRNAWPQALRAASPASSAPMKQVRAVLAQARMAVWISILAASTASLQSLASLLQLSILETSPSAA